MQLAHRVALDGAQLDQIDPRIIIKGVEGAAARENTGAAGLAGADGSRSTGRRRESLEVTVRFSLNIRRDSLAERDQVLDEILDWARGGEGGYLTVNYKTGKRLLIDEAQLPGEGDLWKRFNEYSLIFRARSLPYWEAEEESEAESESGSSGEAEISLGGTASTDADIDLTNTGDAAIDTATITANGTRYTFANLGLAAGATLRIRHSLVSGKRILSMRISGVSVMGRRSDDSSDEIRLRPGENTVSYSVGGTAQLTVRARGRWV